MTRTRENGELGDREEKTGRRFPKVPANKRGRDAGVSRFRRAYGG